MNDDDPLCTGLQSGLIHSGLLSGFLYAFLMLISMLYGLPTSYLLNLSF
jgi:tetrahydromethanopterin S-methyltransferase subunit F